MIALLVGTMGVIGCGDDSSSGNGNGNGTGGTPSNGSVCDDCANQSDIPLCEVCYDECDNPNEAACVAVGLACCATI
jgi:hypothetical protein